jgi:hypothetical protein
MMVHQCKVQCHAIDPKTVELTGLEDKGKWLPFIFNMDIIDAAKLSSDEADSPTYNCTTIFTSQGDTYIIDTPYEEFFKKFNSYNNLQIIIKEDDEDINDDDDLEL